MHIYATRNVGDYRTVCAYGRQSRVRLLQDMLILRGTKHQLSVYDKMPRV